MVFSWYFNDELLPPLASLLGGYATDATIGLCPIRLTLLSPLPSRVSLAFYDPHSPWPGVARVLFFLLSYLKVSMDEKVRLSSTPACLVPQRFPQTDVTLRFNPALPKHSHHGSPVTPFGSLPVTGDIGIPPVTDRFYDRLHRSSSTPTISVRWTSSGVTCFLDIVRRRSPQTCPPPLPVMLLPPRESLLLPFPYDRLAGIMEALSLFSSNYPPP